MSGQTLRESFVNHVLATAGMDDEVIILLMQKGKVNTIHKIKTLTALDLEILKEDLDLAHGDIVTIKGIQIWLNRYPKGNSPLGNTMPGTLEGGKDKFTYESFVEYSQEEEATPDLGDRGAFKAPFITSSGGMDDPSSASTVSSLIEYRPVAVKLSDYPTFRGKTREWFDFYLKFESTAICAGNSDFLQITDFSAHDTELVTNQHYKAANKNLYAILLKVCAGGDAQALITKHHETQDGARAWKELKERFHTEGNLDVQVQECLESIMNLHLDYDSPGGMEHYLNKFESLCQMLEVSGTDNGLTENQKKTFLLKNITDRDYNSTKDLCQDKSLDQCITALRKKSRMVQKINGPGPTKEIRSRRQNKVASILDPLKKGESLGILPGSLPVETWNRLNPKLKSYWMKLKREIDYPDSVNKYQITKGSVSTHEDDAKDDSRNLKSLQAQSKPLETGSDTPKEISITNPVAHPPEIDIEPEVVIPKSPEKDKKGANKEKPAYIVGNIWRPLSPNDLLSSDEQEDDKNTGKPMVIQGEKAPHKHSEEARRLYFTAREMDSTEENNPSPIEKPSHCDDKEEFNTNEASMSDHSGIHLKGSHRK